MFNDQVSNATIGVAQTGEQLVRVGQDTRLNYRVLDVRTPANQATFRIQCHVEDVSAQSS